MQDLSSILGLKAEPVPSGPDDVVLTEKAAFGDVAFPAPSPAEPDGLSPVRKLGFAIVLTVAACATASAPGLIGGANVDQVAHPVSPEMRALTFALEAPQEASLGKHMKLWATHYHTPQIRPAAETISAAFPLIDRKGEAISPPLSPRDWCNAALQGSVSIRAGGKSTAYVYVDSNGPDQANCDEWLGSLTDGVKNATRRARFMKVKHALGCGVRNHALVPFRTIAVDPDVIPLESVVYVPKLRGRRFTQDGETFTHDGYLYAGDRGGAIRGNHIDVFLEGDASPQLQALFAATDTRTFSAHLVAKGDPMAAAFLTTQSSQCGGVTPG
jgi:3D (Asp-Asp-Asp) domain-containing protein